MIAAELFEGATPVGDTNTADMTNLVCLTGTIGADDNGTDAAMNATSCAVAKCTVTGTTTGQDVVYSAESSLYGKVNAPTSRFTTTDWNTAITDTTGYAGGWIW